MGRSDAQQLPLFGGKLFLGDNALFIQALKLLDGLDGVLRRGGGSGSRAGHGGLAGSSGSSYLLHFCAGESDGHEGRCQLVQRLHFFPVGV